MYFLGSPQHYTRIHPKLHTKTQGSGLPVGISSFSCGFSDFQQTCNVKFRVQNQKKGVSRYTCVYHPGYRLEVGCVSMNGQGFFVSYFYEYGVVGSKKRYLECRLITFQTKTRKPIKKSKVQLTYRACVPIFLYIGP